jgi:hypothetical protein
MRKSESLEGHLNMWLKKIDLADAIWIQMASVLLALAFVGAWAVVRGSNPVSFASFLLLGILWAFGLSKGLGPKLGQCSLLVGSFLFWLLWQPVQAASPRTAVVADWTLIASAVLIILLAFFQQKALKSANWPASLLSAALLTALVTVSH